MSCVSFTNRTEKSQRPDPQEEQLKSKLIVRLRTAAVLSLTRFSAIQTHDSQEVLKVEEPKMKAREQLDEERMEGKRRRNLSPARVTT